MNDKDALVDAASRATSISERHRGDDHQVLLTFGNVIDCHRFYEAVRLLLRPRDEAEDIAVDDPGPAT